MNRRSFFSNIPLMGAVFTAGIAIIEPKPKIDYILTLGTPQCPRCLITFDCSIKTDEQARYLNWNPETQEITVEHPSLNPVYERYNCQNAGVKLRFKLPRVTAEVVT